MNETILDKISQRLVETRQRASAGLLREVKRDLASYYEKVYQEYKKAVEVYDEMQGTLKNHPSPSLEAKASSLLNNLISPLDEWLRDYSPSGKNYQNIVRGAVQNMNHISLESSEESDFLHSVNDLVSAGEYNAKSGDVYFTDFYFHSALSSLNMRINAYRKRLKNLIADYNGTESPEQRKELAESMSKLEQTTKSYSMRRLSISEQYHLNSLAAKNEEKRRGLK